MTPRSSCFRNSIVSDCCIVHRFTDSSGGATVFAAIRSSRSSVDILMATTMALVWTVNSTISWRCNYAMQWNLG